MKNPYEEIKDIYYENLDRVRENTIRNFENSEKFMLWIVGFAISGLSLIVSNFSTLNEHYDFQTIKIVLVSLTVSIVSGIIYRWAFYSFQINYQHVEFYLKGAFSNRKTMSTTRYDVSTITDFRWLIFKMNNDFGIDLAHDIEFYEKSDLETQDFLLEKLKTYYTSMNDLAIDDYNLAVKYVDDTHKIAFGLSDKKIEKLKERNTVKLLKIYGKITIVGFIISCLSFIFVIVLLTVLY